MGELEQRLAKLHEAVLARWCVARTQKAYGYAKTLQRHLKRFARRSQNLFNIFSKPRKDFARMGFITF